MTHLPPDAVALLRRLPEWSKETDPLVRSLLFRKLAERVEVGRIGGDWLCRCATTPTGTAYLAALDARRKGAEKARAKLTKGKK